MALLDFDMQCAGPWALLTQSSELKEPGWCRDGGGLYIRCLKCKAILTAENSDLEGYHYSRFCIVCKKCGAHIFYFLAGLGKAIAKPDGPQSKCCKDKLHRFGSADYCATCWRKYIT